MTVAVQSPKPTRLLATAVPACLPYSWPRSPVPFFVLALASIAQVQSHLMRCKRLRERKVLQGRAEESWSLLTSAITSCWFSAPETRPRGLSKPSKDSLDTPRGVHWWCRFLGPILYCACQILSDVSAWITSGILQTKSTVIQFLKLVAIKYS